MIVTFGILGTLIMMTACSPKGPLEGKALINSFEKNVTLAIIDEAWKVHLREMDDLKQSVQNAVYEHLIP